MGRVQSSLSSLAIAALGFVPIGACSLVARAASPQAAAAPQADPLMTTSGIDAINGSVARVDHNGRHALRFVRAADAQPDSSMLAILPVGDFHNGTIEIDVAGSPRPGADEYARGFIGIAFRVQGRGEKMEEFYLRPTNGRASDPERRSHAVQYVSEPDYPWQRLRKEHPGVYEAPADLVPDEWTRMKIVVSGTSAQLYLNDAAQPSLTVNDLKLGDSHGGIALWSHETTDGYFSNLKITRN
ncbi:MAG TPA: hypothetical protein VLZ50_12015 [Terracidiphilus sp.]|nr:hypothetical protein [Terracidiphilus sp.]